MALIRHGRLVDDHFTDAVGAALIPAKGAVIVGLLQWLDNVHQLSVRRDPLGIRLRSDQHPEVIADDLDCFAVIELEFPVLRDGRPYHYARLLREQWGFHGELRATGVVLLEQMPFMRRAGFDSFHVVSADPLGAWRTAEREFATWYQPTADRRVPAHQLRRQANGSRRSA